MKCLRLLKSLIMPLIIGLFTMVQISAGIAGPKVITWEELIPFDQETPAIDFSQFDKPKGIPDISEFDGSKEEMSYFIQDMELLRQSQPQDGNALAYNLNGQEIKIAGYITPLSFDGDKVVEFLFVPYLGACIHVPPPPANQIIYVENAEGLETEELFDPVYLIGKLDAKPVFTVAANVGYSMKKARVEPYTE